MKRVIAAKIIRGILEPNPRGRCSNRNHFDEATIMARKYSKAASKKVANTMHERKAGTLKSGRSHKTVKSRKQAIAIGLSQARRAGEKVPKKKS